MTDTEREEQTKQWAAKEFGILSEEVLWYHSGICYDRIGVTTKNAADKVTAKVKGQTVNGGMLDGMPLGGQNFIDTSEIPHYDVYC